MPELVLLTHSTELERPTNTGRLLIEPPQTATHAHSDWTVRQLCWQRKVPDPLLLQQLATSAYVLLYPGATAQQIDVDHPVCTTFTKPAGFILLDATWQQAQKMYNQSPYLHALPKWQIRSATPSRYILRRNQRQQGWCTAELVVLLWHHLGAVEQAKQLDQRFIAFNQRQGAVVAPD
ncbi:MAG: tRNA-uridine aminocarboxypropyltransferase [Rheinheimera sp.]|nr:tRNA-uridine aminocarboxypropyltransferase [Rheinheimera sp.]